LGKSRFEAEKVRSVEEDRVVVENLVDRGQYIRKEKLYSSF
jgi:60S ribosome subunit biogenesis protein NIP7